jgi:hypothetical protein
MHLSRVGVAIGVALVAALWGGYLHLVGRVPLGWQHAVPFSFVVGGLVLAGLLFEHRLWRAPMVRNFVGRPCLRGTWEVTLQSSSKKPGSDQPIPLVRCFAAVEQSYSKFQLRLITPESESWLVADSVTKSPKGSGYQIVGVYTNQPNVHVRERSEMHRGALWLDSHGERTVPDSLSGEYWTDRQTKGTLSMHRRVDRVHSSYAQAAAEFDAL